MGVRLLVRESGHRGDWIEGDLAHLVLGLVGWCEARLRAIGLVGVVGLRAPRIPVLLWGVVVGWLLAVLLLRVLLLRLGIVVLGIVLVLSAVRMLRLVLEWICSLGSG